MKQRYLHQINQNRNTHTHTLIERERYRKNEIEGDRLHKINC